MGSRAYGKMHAPRQAVQPSSVGFAGSRPKESRLRPNSYPPAAAVGGAPTSSSGSCQVVGAHFLLKDINSLQARLAQSVEHETLNLRVVGSSLTLVVCFLDDEEAIRFNRFQRFLPIQAARRPTLPAT